MKEFRRQNITGIKYLSIGTTINTRKKVMTRYSVHLKKDGKNIQKSFYFGVNTKQIKAFNNSIDFMIKNKLYN